VYQQAAFVLRLVEACGGAYGGLPPVSACRSGVAGVADDVSAS
jgi:hypothetical protein